MFMKDELEGLKSVFDRVENVPLNSFLTTEDILAIDNEADQLHNKNKRKHGDSMVLRNLRNRMISPKNHFRFCTVTIQRLHSGYDFIEWLEKIAEKILFNENTQVKIGFSFLCWKPMTNERIYFFSAKELAPFRFKVDTEDELLAEFKKVGTLTDSEILNRTFVNSIPDNPFAKSGFIPLKIVCSYVYITK